MKEDKKIEELFRNKLESFESPVNDAMWSNISTGISASSGASAAVGKTLAGKIFSTAAIIVTTGVVATGITVMVMSSNEEEGKAERNIADVVLEDKTIKEDAESKLIDQTPEIDEVVPNLEPVDAEDPQVKEVKTEVYKVELKESEESYSKELSAATSFMTSRSDLERQKTESNNNTTEVTEESQNEVIYTDNAITVTKIDENHQVASITASSVGGYAPLEVNFSNQSEGGTVSWSFGDGNMSREEFPTHTFEKAGEYTVELILTDENGNVSKDQRTIEVEAKSSVTSIPNIFTPNGDGKNETFLIKGENIEEYLLVIIDKTGKEVFSSNSIEKGWNGKDKFGKNVEKGSYFFVMSAVGIDGKKYEHKGSIRLNR